jgi:ABC-2 type transport system ATP-binding protein
VSIVKKRGRTVFMSSHVLSEVDRVCDRIALVRKGEIVLLAPVEETRKLAARHVRVSFSEDVNFTPIGEVVEIRPRLWNLKIEGPMGPLLRQLRHCLYTISKLPNPSWKT